MGIKKIGVLTSGGDAPGMNAAIRSVTRSAIAAGIEVLGVYRGYNGLLHKDVVKMDLRSVSNIIQLGGTMLYTARSPEFNTPEGVKKAAANCRELGIDGLVVIGGDGSYRGARDLCAEGIHCVGLPGTIDNDISSTEYTIGYDTAMNTAVEMVDKIRDTSQSHDRCTVVEVMGRHAGHIALNVGIAVGATAILVPEEPFDLDKEVVEPMKRSQATGKQHFNIVVAEGVGHVDEIVDEIQKKTGVETRGCILGHVQRGGSPSLRDRVVASEMGYYAVQLLRDGKSNRIVGMKDGRVYDCDITEGLAMKKTVDKNLLNIARVISI